MTPAERIAEMRLWLDVYRRGVNVELPVADVDWLLARIEAGERLSAAVRIDINRVDCDHATEGYMPCAECVDDWNRNYQELTAALAAYDAGGAP